MQEYVNGLIVHALKSMIWQVVHMLGWGGIAAVAAGIFLLFALTAKASSLMSKPPVLLAAIAVFCLGLYYMGGTARSGQRIARSILPPGVKAKSKAAVDPTSAAHVAEPVPTISNVPGMVTPSGFAGFSQEVASAPHHAGGHTASIPSRQAHASKSVNTANAGHAAHASGSGGHSKTASPHHSLTLGHEAPTTAAGHGGNGTGNRAQAIPPTPSASPGPKTAAAVHGGGTVGNQAKAAPSGRASMPDARPVRSGTPTVSGGGKGASSSGRRPAAVMRGLSASSGRSGGSPSDVPHLTVVQQRRIINHQRWIAGNAALDEMQRHLGSQIAASQASGIRGGGSVHVGGAVQPHSGTPQAGGGSHGGGGVSHGTVVHHLTGVAH